jgi:EAL domain-containing protein (putative c-di-GMP-specific phosphodiesterase class I)
LSSPDGANAPSSRFLPPSCVVEKALKRSGLAPNRLEIELTESVVLDGAESTVDVLSRLKQVGVSIAVDDFGPGYSSLSYLRRMPIDKVKMDQTFVRDIVTDHGDSAIVQAVIAMSHHLKLSVVAKGVETEPQAAFLRHCRCDVAQGVLFGAPMPAAALTELLEGSGNHPGQPDPSGAIDPAPQVPA